MFPEKLHLGSALRAPSAKQLRYHVPRRFIGSLEVWPKGKLPEPTYYKQFNLSPLILDLDSEDAKNVRVYDPELDGVPEAHGAKSKRERKAIQIRINRFRHEHMADEKAFLTASRRRYFERLINDCDLFSTVLRRPLDSNLKGARPSTLFRAEMANMTEEEMAEHIMLWNGIPRFAWNDASVALPYMLRRRDRHLKSAKVQKGQEEKNENEKEETQKYLEDNQEKELRDGLLQEGLLLGGESKTPKGKAPENKTPPPEIPLTSASLLLAIADCPDLVSLRRFVQTLLWVPDGGKLASELSDTIGESCARLTDLKDPSSLLESTAFLNDIFMNLSAKGLPVSAKFRDVGILLAVRCSAFSAARSYLRVDIGAGNPDYLKEVLLLMESSVKGDSLHQRNHTTGPPSREHLAGIFSLLSGQDISGHHSPYSIQAWLRTAPWPKRITAIDQRENALEIYIRILGELGALRSLWHVFQALSVGTLDLQWRERARARKRTRSIHYPRSKMFLAAFARTLTNVMSHRLTLEQLSAEKATGKFLEDCRLDLRTIVRSTRVTREVCSTLDSHSNAVSAAEQLLANQTDLNAVSLPHENAEAPGSPSRGDSQAGDILSTLDISLQKQILEALDMRVVNCSMKGLYDILRQASQGDAAISSAAKG